jgi:hypothetical protein
MPSLSECHERGEPAQGGSSSRPCIAMIDEVARREATAPGTNRLVPGADRLLRGLRGLAAYGRGLPESGYLGRSSASPAASAVSRST